MGKNGCCNCEKEYTGALSGRSKEPVLAELKKKDEVTVVESEQNWKRCAQQMV